MIPWISDTLSWQYLDAEKKGIRTSPGGVTETHIGDTQDRTKSIENPLGLFTFGYDGESDRALSIQHSGGFDTAFAYLGADDQRAPQTITSTLPGGASIGKHTYSYDDQNRIDSWKRETPLANPIGTTHGYQWKNYYDFSSQLTSVAEKSLTGTQEQGWDYQHDLAGNIRSIQESSHVNNSVSLVRGSHDASNRITRLGTSGDAVIRGTLSEPGDVSVAIAATDTSGNRSNYRFNVTLPTTNVSPLSFTYDLNGNLTSDGMRSYEWDIHSRLKKVTWGAGRTTEFKYNALGQRSESTDTVGSVATSHFYLFDGIRLIDRRTGSTADTATIDRRYFSQGEQRKNGSAWENYFYCRDHLGSIGKVANSLARTNTLVASYDPYGKHPFAPG